MLLGFVINASLFQLINLKVHSILFCEYYEYKYNFNKVVHVSIKNVKNIFFEKKLKILFYQNPSISHLFITISCQTLLLTQSVLYIILYINILSTKYNIYDYTKIMVNYYLFCFILLFMNNIIVLICNFIFYWLITTVCTVYKTLVIHDG